MSSTVAVVEKESAGEVCKPLHCYYCCDSLLSALTDDEALPCPVENDKYPLFVTWSIKSSRRGGHTRLRGCIGNFEGMPLKDGLKDYALISAFQDTRFSPITADELPRLVCGVSLLTDFEDAANYLDWEVGTHGIYITFPHPHSLPPPSSSTDPSPLSSSSSTPVPPSERSHHWWNRSGTRLRPLTATYLPEIAPEQGWTKTQAVDSAIRKAGWDGRITEDIRRSIKLRRYQSRKCEVTWDEYLEWRKQQTGAVEAA